MKRHLQKLLLVWIFNPFLATLILSFLIPTQATVGGNDFFTFVGNRIASPSGIEVTDSIVQVDEVVAPENRIFSIEGRNDTIYLIAAATTSSEPKLYVSSDLGNSWTLKYTFTGYFPMTQGYGLFVTTNGTIIVSVKVSGDNYAIFRSGDGGSTFTEVAQSLPSEKKFWKATEDLYGNIYIGLYPSYPYVYKSSDNGQTWSIFWNGTPYSESHIHAVGADPYTGAIWFGTGDPRCLLVSTYDNGTTFNVQKAPTITALAFTSRYVLTGRDASRNVLYDKQTGNYSYWFLREKDYFGHINHMASYQDKVYAISTSQDHFNFSRNLPAVYAWYDGDSVRLFRGSQPSNARSGFVEMTPEPVQSKWFVIWVDKDNNEHILRFNDLTPEEIVYLSYKQSPIFYSESTSSDTLTRRIVLLADEEVTVSFADSYITNAEIRLLPYQIVENSSMIRYTWDFEDGQIPSGFFIDPDITAGVVSNYAYNGTNSLSLNDTTTTVDWVNTGIREMNWTSGFVPDGYVGVCVMHMTQSILSQQNDWSSAAKAYVEFWNDQDIQTAFAKWHTLTQLNETYLWNFYGAFNSTQSNKLWKARIVWKLDAPLNFWVDSIQFYIVNDTMFEKIAHDPPFIHDINETPNKLYINNTLYTVNGWTSLSALGEVKTLKLKLKSGGMGAVIAEIRGTMKFKSNMPFTKGANVYYAKTGSSLTTITNYNTGILTVYSVTDESSITSTTYMDNTLSFTISVPSGITSTTEVYCGIRGEPIAIYTANGTLTWSYNAFTTILTLNATHASPTKILVYWKFPGDTDTDGDVDINDLYILAVAYESRVGEPKYNSNSDIDGNGHVNSDDLHILAEDYGELQP